MLFVFDMLQKLIKETVNIDCENIPSKAIEKASELFIDTIACIYAGSSAEGIDRLRGLCLQWGPGGKAEVFCFKDQISAPYAALLNSVMAHARDYDDTHDGAVNHGCVTIVPALLAAVDSIDRAVSGKEFLTAMAVGLEISNRLGMAFIDYLHAGWLPTTLWGSFGAAAACGRLLGLNTEQMANAFGFAYSVIHGNRQALDEGKLAKRIQPGFSARAGLEAAYYAKSGLSAAENIIEGNFSIPKLFTNNHIQSDYLEAELATFSELENISIKPYPSCRCTHPVIDAALEIKEKRSISTADIAKGSIYLPPCSRAQIGRPFEIRQSPTVDAQFSAAYTASLALNKGTPRLVDFEPNNIRSREDII